MASKFLLLQESVRDAADLYLSLKYPSLLLVNDTPCGFARYLDLREPVIAVQFWGDRLGCFEKPTPGTKPKEVQYYYINNLLSLIISGRLMIYYNQKLIKKFKRLCLIHSRLSQKN